MDYLTYTYRLVVLQTRCKFRYQKKGRSGVADRSEVIRGGVAGPGERVAGTGGAGSSIQ